MPTTDSMRETLEHFVSEEKKLLADLSSVRLTIQSIKRALGLDTQNSEISESSNGQMIDVSVPSVTGSIAGGKLGIRADEFFGMTHAEAARQYLKKVGHAVSFEELADALRKGGCKLTGVDPKKILYISLIRNSRDFVPPQAGFVGLREFYPGRVRTGPERQVAPSARRRARKIRSTPKHRPKATKPATLPSPITAALKQALGHGEQRTRQELVGIATEKLGQKVAPISVAGALRSKDFREVDGKYELAK
jgi:hypothetical protein